MAISRNDLAEWLSSNIDVDLENDDADRAAACKALADKMLSAFDISKKGEARASGSVEDAARTGYQEAMGSGQPVKRRITGLEERKRQQAAQRQIGEAERNED